MNPSTFPGAQDADHEAAAPRIEDSLVRIPDGQDVPQEPAPEPRPWYRRRRSVLVAIAAIAALLGGLAAGLLTTVFASSGPADPADVLKADGYSVLMTATPAQMASMGDSADASALKPYITSFVIGTKGGNVEVVMTLTALGRDTVNAGDLSAVANGMGSGFTAHMKDGYVVADGPVSSLALNGSSSQAG